LGAGLDHFMTPSLTAVEFGNPFKETAGGGIDGAARSVMLFSNSDWDRAISSGMMPP